MRMYVDCREQPSVMNCSLRISGEPDEVVRAASEHAESVHGHQNTPELRDGIRRALKEERGAKEETRSASPRP